MLIATPATRLTRVAWVYFDHSDTTLLCLVCKEGVELGKAPTMQATFRVVLLALTDLATLSYVLEIFQHQGAALWGVLYNAFGEDVITVSVESYLSALEFSQVLFRRFARFRLQLTTEAEITAIHFFPVLATKEVMVGSHSRAIESQVYPDDTSIHWDMRLRHRDDDMQPELPMPITQVGSRNWIARVFGAVGRNSERNTHSASTGREAYFPFVPLEHIGFLIVTYWTELRLRHLHGFELGDRLALFPGFLYPFGVVGNGLGLPRQGRFDRLRGFHTGLNEQVTDQPRTGYLQITIGSVM